MISRLTQLALFAATSSFACIASTKCLPDVMAKRLTMIKGNADFAMVQEYSSMGCNELKLDSIVRRSVPAESLRISRSWAYDKVNPSPAVTIYGSFTRPKYDSIGMITCAKIRTIRRIDSIPRVSVPVALEGSDLSGETPVPVNPDSVYVCLNGNCSRIVPRVVENLPDSLPCLIGIAAPLHTPEEALAYLKGLLAKASSVSTLRRFPDIVVRPMCPITVYVNAARKASLFPVYVKETRLDYVEWNSYGLPALRDWNDSSISKRLALISSSNAGDFYAPETLSFHRTSLFKATDEAKRFQYATGIEHYLYTGSMLPPYANCLDALTVPRPEPTRVGDSLRLEGLSLHLSTSTTCPAPGIDIQAGKYNTWLFAPTSEATLQKDFFHGSSPETQNSWPIENDSVLVRGQKIPMAVLQSFVATLPRPDERRFSARVLDGALSVTLEQPGTLRISTLDGRILSTKSVPAGRSTIAVPQGHRGILLVSEGSRTIRVPAP